ncbi:MAG: hypothetical protein ABW252_01280 [Polyangiales bacterium]
MFGASSHFSRVRRATPILLALLALLALGSAAPASAQSTAAQLADANKSAMDAYNNLDIDAARAQLEKAAQSAEKSGLRGAPLARTYANLGVVLVGAGDKAGAIAQFKRALKEDSRVEPDPLVATPDVNAAFAEARASAPASSSRRPAPAARRTVEGNLDHAPALEQLVQTAIPVFVKKTSELTGATLKVFYRSRGMQKPRAAEMQETDDGFTYLVPCADVFEPVVEYFIVALDGSGAQLGNSGTPAAPVQVQVVTERSQPAPSLPGQMPPAPCAGAAAAASASRRRAAEPSDEQAPARFAEGGGGLGDTCARSSDCGAGLTCEDNFCTGSPSRKSDDDDDDSASSGAKRFFLELNFGVGATYVGSGRAPDHSPPQETLEAATNESRDAEDIPDPEIAGEALEREGWACRIQEGEMDSLRFSQCTVAVRPGGFVAIPVVNFAAGYYATERFALALTGRIQFSRGQGALAGILVGARGEYLLTRPVPTGFRLGLVAGFAVGQLQARPPAEGTRSGPFATNASLGPDGVAKMGVAASAGLRAVYRFLPNLGFSFMPALHLGLPNTLIDIDIAAGAEIAF